MELKIKLYLTDEEGEKFMGIGVLWLLQRVAEHGSLRQGAMSLGISYSKALMMVQNLEHGLGIRVLNRRKGGSQRDGATLTSFGKHFISLYQEFEQEAKRRIDDPFAHFSNELGQLIDRWDTDEEEDSNE